MKPLRIGSRESRLAIIQSEIVIQAIHDCDPQLQTELVTMKTTGDIILDRTLDKIGGKGLFVKELDAALLDGRVDLTVHSSKDLPMEIDPRLPLVAFSKRGDPRDVLVLPQGQETLDFSKPIGCSSLRRQLQLKSCSRKPPWPPSEGTCSLGFKNWTAENFPRWYWRAPVWQGWVWSIASAAIFPWKRFFPPQDREF